MFVLTFFHEVDIGLVVDEELMAAVSDADARGIELVAISHVYAMEDTANHCRDRIGGTVSHAGVQVSVLVLVVEPCRHVAPVGHTVGTHKHAGVY